MKKACLLLLGILVFANFALANPVPLTGSPDVTVDPVVATCPGVVLCGIATQINYPPVTPLPTNAITGMPYAFYFGGAGSTFNVNDNNGANFFSGVYGTGDEGSNFVWFYGTITSAAVGSPFGNGSEVLIKFSNPGPGGTLDLAHLTDATAADISAVPEPATLVLLASGLTPLFMRRRRR